MITVGGQDILTLIVISIISFFAGAVKTILMYTRERILPNRLDFIVNIILSFFIGVLAGFICAYLKLQDTITFVIVALAALSAERLLSAIPTIFVKKVEDIAGVKPTKEDYEMDPSNKGNK